MCLATYLKSVSFSLQPMHFKHDTQMSIDTEKSSLDWFAPCSPV